MMRRTLAAGGALALICGPTVLAFFSGGYFERPRLVAGVLAFAAMILAACVAPRPLPRSMPGRLALGGLLLLCLWSALSILWAPIGARANGDLQRLLLYLAFFAAAAALLRGRVRPWLEPLLVLGAFVVVAYGLSERLLPDLIELSRSRSAAGRLEQPLSYWNAFGAIAAIGFVLAARVAGDPARQKGVRAAAAGAGVWFGAGTYLSFSRGALAAAAGGLLILIALAPAGRAQLRGALALTVAAALAALLASGFDGIQSLEVGEQGDSGEGLLMLVFLLLLSFGAGVVVLRRPRVNVPMPELSVSRPVAVLTATVLVVLAGGLAVVLLEGKPEGVSPALAADPERFQSIDTNRYRYWEVALQTWLDHPIAGIGSGGFQVRWLRERDRVDPSGDAHSLYVETVAELGLVGLGFLALFIGGIVAAALRLYRLDPSTAAGPVAGLAAWSVHAGLDWDWEMPAVTLIALLLAAAVVAWSEAPDEPSARGRPLGIC